MTSNRRVAIGGASSDIGGVLVRHYIRARGHRVVGTMRRAATNSDPRSRNLSIMDMCDLAQPACCDRLAKELDDAFDGPFAYIHSVGNFWDHVPFLSFPPEVAAEMLASHVTTFYNVTQSLVPVLIKKGGGSVVAFSCNSVRYNYPWMAAFTSSKAAIESLVKSLAHEFSGKSIRFNAIVLASMKTEKVIASKPRGDTEHYLPPEDIIPAVDFLISDKGRHVTGNAINVYMHSDSFYKRGYFERIKK